MEIRTLKIAVVKEGVPIFDERTTTVEIIDDATGEYVRVQQTYDDIEPGAVKIDASEWPKLRSAIDQMISECRGQQDEANTPET